MRARRGLSLLVAAAWLPASPAPLSFLLLSSTLVSSTSGSHAALVRYEGTRFSMGCAYTIVAFGEDAGALPRIVGEAFDEVDRLDRLMSHYRPESPLSRLNRTAAAAAVRIDPELFAIVAESLRYSRESDGAFDITVGPLMKAWGFFNGEGRLPARRELEAARQRVGYRHVILDADAGTVRFDRAGVELDLGGIGKGYAVDRIVNLLRARQVRAALVSAGGSTIYALGAPPDEEGWRVSVQDPLHADPRRTALTLLLRDRSISIAGRSEKAFEVKGVTYSHIMDPRTGRPAQGMLTVAVLSATGMAGDALDDVFLVLGVEKSREYLRRLSQSNAAQSSGSSAGAERVEAYFFRPDGRRGWTVTHELPDGSLH